MPLETGNPELDEKIKERFESLPKIVQDAIISADVTRHLQELAASQKLHYDQWDKLEIEVKFTLLGLEPIENLEENIKKEVGLNDQEAHKLAIDIGQIVFEPIRQQLERNLEHPDAREEKKNTVELARSAELSTAATEASATPPQGNTPPPATQENVKTAPQRSWSATYQSGTLSHERGSFEGDPYREQP